ncbi:MAG: class I SAM-dependent RNA methyltransferase [Micromonosporaceae bacterium]
MNDDAVVELTVERVAHGGHCVAHHEGRVVFVRHALPGERVRAQVTEVHKNFLRADAIEILDASPDRVTAPCPYAGPGLCGGCDFQHASRAAQRRLKAEVVREQLLRLGGLSEAELAALGAAEAGGIEVLPLPGESPEGSGLGWRTRVQYAVDGSGRAGLRRHRSHDVLAIDRCRIAAPEIQDAPVTSRSWKGWSAVEAVRGATGETTVFARRRRGSEDFQLESGPATVTERALGAEWVIPPQVFWQVHPGAADTFATAVLDLLDPRPGERAWDLYGGAGLFTAALASRVGPQGRVTLVESDPEAVAAARLALAGLTNVRSVTGRVDDALGTRRMRATDLVVLDPPRSGAGAVVVSALIAASPRAVAYVACDPAALARDVRTFRDQGWRLARLRAYDAFPMTHHVECVALLTPAQSDPQQQVTGDH